MIILLILSFFSTVLWEVILKISKKTILSCLRLRPIKDKNHHGNRRSRHPARKSLSELLLLRKQANSESRLSKLIKSRLQVLWLLKKLKQRLLLKRQPEHWWPQIKGAYIQREKLARGLAVILEHWWPQEEGACIQRKGERLARDLAVRPGHR